MSHVLMVCYPFPPNSSAGAIRSERIARYLDRFGWKVSVVTIEPREDMFKDIELYRTLLKSVTIHQTRNVDPWLSAKKWQPNGQFRQLTRSVLLKAASYPDHMVCWVPFAVRKALQVHRESRIDVVYTTSPPHSSLLAGLFISKLLHIPWAADLRDPLWTLIPMRYSKRVCFQQNFENWLERFLLKRTHLVIANTAMNLRKLLLGHPFLKSEKVIHIGNGWEELPSQNEERNNSGKLLILHAGNFYPKYKPYGLLYAIKELRERDSERYRALSEKLNIWLLGAKDEYTHSVVKELELEEIVTFLPWVPLQGARKVMLKADLLWASLGSSQESANFLPSKVLEYIGARKPILGFFPDGEARSFIEKSQTGRVFRDNESSVLIDYLFSLTRLKENNCLDSIYKPKQKVLDAFHIEALVKKLSDALLSICDH